MILKELTEKLHAGQYSCVIAQGTEVRTFTQRGVADLYDLLQQEPAFLKGSLIADKVVGKAAAALMVLGGMQKLHADVISQPAINLLQEAGIEVEAIQTVPHIENRNKSGWCPLETASYPLCSAEEIFQTIEQFMAKRSSVS